MSRRSQVVHESCNGCRVLHPLAMEWRLQVHTRSHVVDGSRDGSRVLLLIRTPVLLRVEAPAADQRVDLGVLLVDEVRQKRVRVSPALYHRAPQPLNLAVLLAEADEQIVHALLQLLYLPLRLAAPRLEPFLPQRQRLRRQQLHRLRVGVHGAPAVRRSVCRRPCDRPHPLVPVARPGDLHRPRVRRHHFCLCEDPGGVFEGVGGGVQQLGVLCGDHCPGRALGQRRAPLPQVRTRLQ
mmetsp:Transcript_33062/g.55348  ORF Transcript_33062/g.55348 Transcript_33062/m.55348 type:complete len:238 (-) Transcript_33062:1364-2077(-)